MLIIAQHIINARALVSLSRYCSKIIIYLPLDGEHIMARCDQYAITYFFRIIFNILTKILAHRGRINTARSKKY